MKIRTAESIKGAGGLKYGIITVGDGDWEITNLSVATGSFETGHVRIVYRHVDGPNTIDDYLYSGPIVGAQRPVVMPFTRRMKGPGQIISIGYHDQDFAHTLTVQYRRVRD